MRAYTIDELYSEDVARIEQTLTRKGWTGAIKGIYYMPIAEEFLGPEQREHGSSCGPFFLPLEVGDNWVRLEFLVRSRKILRCSCVAYANPKLREEMINTLDNLIKSLDIAV